MSTEAREFTDQILIELIRAGATPDKHIIATGSAEIRATDQAKYITTLHKELLAYFKADDA